MNSLTTEILILVLLILVNGLFSLSEMAVVSARKVRLQQQAEEGSKGAQTALSLAVQPTRFLLHDESSKTKLLVSVNGNEVADKKDFGEMTDLTSYLNALGAEGWEMVNADRYEYAFKIIFLNARLDNSFCSAFTFIQKKARRLLCILMPSKKRPMIFQKRDQRTIIHPYLNSLNRLPRK
jgi:hypothetical protein